MLSMRREQLLKQLRQITLGTYRTTLQMQQV